MSSLASWQHGCGYLLINLAWAGLSVDFFAGVYVDGWQVMLQSLALTSAEPLLPPAGGDHSDIVGMHGWGQNLE